MMKSERIVLETGEKSEPKKMVLETGEKTVTSSHLTINQSESV